MKRFLKKRWHSIPVSAISAVMLICLLAGSAFAAYNFAKVKVEVTVEEAIVLGYNWCPSPGDDLVPYMVGGGVLPDIIIGAGTGGYNMDVTIKEKAGVDASEFCPGETLVIPLNMRNKSDGSITVDITKGGTTNLEIKLLVIGPGVNTGWVDSINLAMAGHQGAFGSDMDCNNVQDPGSTCFYIKVHAPGDCPPGLQTFRLDFSRS